MEKLYKNKNFKKEIKKRGNGCTKKNISESLGDNLILA